jgi:N-acetylmuramoyl-L-alanine amidase
MNITRHMRSYSAWAVAALLLSACAPVKPHLKLDTSVKAISQSSRVKQIVVHYTVWEKDRALKQLSQAQVSAHYLISDDTPPRIYRLVDENRQAWHAGESRWYGQPSINATSIGIEIVNRGYINDAEMPAQRLFFPYSPAQIESLTLLLNDIVLRHDIAAKNIVGHSDISPQRKADPGPLFPWRQLALHGLGRWYDEAGAASHFARLQAEGVPDTLWFQQQLQRLGYNSPQTGELDTATINVLAAFQMHYRQTLYDGQPDIETAAIMLAIL